MKEQHLEPLGRLARRLRRRHYQLTQLEALLPSMHFSDMHDKIHSHTAPHANGSACSKPWDHDDVNEEIDESDDVATVDIDALEAEIERLRDQLLRCQAEFDNFRKRKRREEQQFSEQANVDLITQLLPVLDNFERAIEHIESSDDNFVSGIMMIHKHFVSILEHNGLEPIESTRTPFDPNLHEAVSVESSSMYEDGTVIETLLAGYRFRGKLVRPAMVKVIRNS